MNVPPFAITATLPRRIHAAIFALAIFFVPTALSQAPTDMSQLVKSSIDAVVLIVVTDSGGKPVLEGSGFLVSADGKIVTNHHVIATAVNATVKLNNGAFFQVEGIIADDPQHDLAVIKVPGKNLPYLSLEIPENISVGQHVLAIGSPLGLENSVSDGIVSGFRDGENGKSWIQTTAPASHGNSGGPLIVMNGKVAGVITWKAGEGENLNFAVPSALIAPLLTHSAVQPFGISATTTKLASPTGSPDRIWTSMTSGRDYKVRVEGDYIYTEWVNLPAQLQGTAAFMRSELKKDGDRWLGRVRSNLPYGFKSSYGDFWTTGQRMGTENVKWCQIEVDFEIDRVSESRIEGRAMMPSSFDAKKCKPGKSDMKPFTWILK